ncbi:MAG: hypothetical protein ACFFA5_04705 [Promethearchaeota archaeon]
MIDESIIEIDTEVSLLNNQSLEQILTKTIKEYNKYRSPEVVAKLTTVDNSSFKIEFKGHYCYTCGFYDYFDDFRFLLEYDNMKTEIKEIVEIEEGAIVTFTLESQKVLKI